MPGDCYIAACGVASLDDCGYLSVVDGAKGPHEAEDNARRVMAFAKQMMAVSKQVGVSNMMQGTYFPELDTGITFSLPSK